MLRETFLHIDGVGRRREEILWRSGIRTWDDVPRLGSGAGLPASVVHRIDSEVVRSDEALRRGRYRYFADALPAREHWRALPEFRGAVGYLDIETTGLSIGRDAVTVVGVYDGRRERSFVKGENLDELPATLDRMKILVTFNGGRFDLPFLRRAFPRMRLDQIHMDLLHGMHRLGYHGGLKRIEAQLGIERSEETAGLRGWDAVRLWEAHESGDEGALELLLQYNMEDVIHLETLADLAYTGLRTQIRGEEFVTADRLERARGRAP